MAFSMKFAAEEMEGLKPVPPGIYDVMFLGFKPKKSKNGTSINLNGLLKVMGHPELGEERKIFANLNEQIPGFIQDFCHMLGVPMQDQNGANPGIPGVFDGDPTKFKEDDPTTWVYKGPLEKQSGKIEVGLKDYNGEPSQDIIRFICKVSQCETKYPKVRHSKDMRKKG